MWCELVSDFSRLEELSPQWQRWAHENAQATIFQQWEWARAYWKVYGSSVSLCSVAVHENGRILGILPLVRNGNRIEFLGSLEADYNDLLCENGLAAPVLQAALDFFLQSSYRWSTIVLDNIPAQSQILSNLAVLPPKIRRHLQLVFRCSSPAIVVDPNRREALDALIDKRQLKRYEKKLQNLGSLAFRHFENREEARQHLDRFFHQHITRFAMKGLRSQFLEPKRRAFYEALVGELDPGKQLRFGVLELDGRPIAYHFGFQLNGTLTWYKPTFDVNYWEYCPGDVLLRSLLWYVREESLAELDLTLGGEPFKYRFANHVRQNYVMYVERHRARVGSCYRTVVRRAQHIIRQKPEWKSVIQDNARRLQGWVNQFRHLDNAENLWKRCFNRRRTAGRCIWSQDEVFFYASLGKVSARGSAVKVATGKLDDLASLSVEFGYFLKPAKLREYQRRLKDGEQLFIARGQRGEVFVFWLRRQNEILVPEVGNDCQFCGLCRDIWAEALTGCTASAAVDRWATLSKVRS